MNSSTVRSAARCLTLALTAFATLVLLDTAAMAAGGDFDGFEPVTFKIVSADGSQVLGQGEYHLDNSAGTPMVVGQNRYNNGEYDLEHDRLQFRTDGSTPSLLSYEHTYYRADGTPRAMARADIGSRLASCSDYASGREQTAQMDFPSDTYAGATVVLALENLMRGGGGGLHVFDCGPAPRVVLISAQSEGAAQPWGLDPSPVTQVRVTPDLGWMGSMVGGLVPHRSAWFDASGWRFAGAEIQRYLADGPQVLLMRDFETKVKLAQAGTN